MIITSSVLALFFLGLFFLLQDRATESENNAYVDNRPGEIPFAMPPFSVPEFSNDSCNIKNYGAIGDGTFINTNSIKKAIEDCHQKGGGKIIFPEGKWLTGPIHLKSNINLHLEKNSEIIFTANLNDYLPTVFSKFQGMEYYNFSPPIYARDCENIALTGNGKIYGNGDFWENWARTPNSEIEREKLFNMAQAGVPAEERIFGQKDSGLRPSFIQFVSCKNILIEGLTIENGPMWTIHPIYSENITVRHVNINTHSMNTDGIVIDSSKNALIENSSFSTGDDSIAIKSGLEEEGLRINRPSENIIIRNCDFTEGHGAVTIGSEMSGGVHNVFAENLKFRGTGSGLRIKSARSRGGFIENIWVQNIKMSDIEGEAVVINLKYKTALKTPEAYREPVLKGIHFKNIEAESVETGIAIMGFSDGTMEDISFENMKLQTKTESTLKYAKNINFKRMYLEVNSKRPALQIKDSQNLKFNVFECYNAESKCPVRISGGETSNIDLRDSNIKKEDISIEGKNKDKIEKQLKLHGIFNNLPDSLFYKQKT